MDDFIRPGKRNVFRGGKLDGLIQPTARPAFEAIEATSEADIIEPPFKTPDQVAGIETSFPDTIPPDDILPAPIEGGPDTGEIKKPTDPKKKRFWKRLSKKQWIIVGIVTFLVLAGSASGWWFFIRKAPVKQAIVTPTPVQKPPEPPPPTTVPSKLSGLEVDPKVNDRPVTAVMIENSPDARPQSGLLQASVVFEAVAEGGITRFNAIFQDTQPDYIGPVRSVRPYYIDWFWPFDASLAHAGGSPQGLADVRSLHIRDLDQFANSKAYERVSSRFAPHNLYTSIAKLNELETAKGFGTSTFTGFVRRKATPLAVPTAKTIDLKISSYYYNVNYVYDTASNTYKRSEGGLAHKDERTGTQLAPKVVVAIVMQRGIAGDGQHTDYQTTGSGKVYVFQDGGLTEGTWSKSSRQAQWKFADSAGKELAFNPGQTWLTMVDTPGSVSYKP